MIGSALIKKPSFWIISLLFLVVTVILIIYVFPPLFSRFNSLRADSTSLTAERDKQKQYADLLDNLANNKDAVAGLYQSADQALPSTVRADFLLIQLDSLTSSMGLTGVKFVVPFSSGVVATPAPSGSGGTASIGGAANSSPVVKSDSSGSQTTFSISGPIGFSSVQTLLQNLRSLSRWNKITSIELGLNGSEPTATITAQVFTLPNYSSNFTGADSSFLTKAQALFGSAKSYTTQPNSSTEGSYGRANPFAPVK